MVVYHGTPAERAEIRRDAMASVPKSNAATIPKFTATAKGKAKAKSSGKRPKKGRPSKATRKSAVADGDEPMGGSADKDDDAPMPTFPIILTTYEMIIKDRAHMAEYDWGYIVVDEGHRLKNLECRLIKEIKRYHSAGRMILTGTPLHVCGWLTL